MVKERFIPSGAPWGGNGRRQRRFSQFVHPAVLVLLALLTSGCVELTALSFAHRLKPLEAGPKAPVVEIICLWEPAEGLGLDGLPTRGFAGQILFFTAGHPQPLKVNGDVRIYVFDDHGTPEEQSRPIHQFDFAPDAWNAFLRETNIGTAYQVFIPYTRKSTYQTNCSLRVRYTPAGGGSPVYSKMATVVLPGRNRPKTPREQSPEGNSAHVPEGGPAQAESAPPLTLAPASAHSLQDRLSQLRSAAAAAARSLTADGTESQPTPTLPEP